jgi:hypothetical protein
MLHIVPVRARLPLFNIRVNYLGITTQQRHSKCEHVMNILRGIQREHSNTLPSDSADFKVEHGLFWRCTPTKMLELDATKCLCEYGTDEGATFEHELKMIPVSKQARDQLAGIRRHSRMSVGKRQQSKPKLARRSSSQHRIKEKTVDTCADDSLPQSRSRCSTPREFETVESEISCGSCSTTLPSSASTSSASVCSWSAEGKHTSQSLMAAQYSMATHCSGTCKSQENCTAAWTPIQRSLSRPSSATKEHAAQQPCRPFDKDISLPSLLSSSQASDSQCKEEIVALRKATKIAEKALKMAETQRVKAERRAEEAAAVAARVQAERRIADSRTAHVSSAEIEVARRAQHEAERSSMRCC